MNLPRRYSYNARWRLLIGGGGLFAVSAAFFIYELKSGEDFDYHGLKLGPTESKIAFTILLVASMAFVIVSIVATIRRLVAPKILELADDAITVPHGFFQRERSRIAYSNITGLAEIRISGQTILYVYAGARRYTIAASLLPNKSSYEEVKQFLSGVSQVAVSEHPFN